VHEALLWIVIVLKGLTALFHFTNKQLFRSIRTRYMFGFSISESEALEVLLGAALLAKQAPSTSSLTTQQINSWFH